jgi:glycosyltransferase involved in cell wall biosynthesis
MKISICIPTWEQYGYGNKFLSKLLTTIQNQDFTNFNVVISDHSMNKTIYEVIKLFENQFELKYIINEKKRGNSPSNTNNAIINADGEIIKIMFQDDFFYDNTSLSQIHKEFNNDDCYWLINGCNHTEDDGKSFSRFMIPYWNNQIIFGNNTISSPSVLSFRNFNPCLFDEELTMLMDCELYYQLYIKFGYPKVIQNSLITNRLHQYQISKNYKQNILSEINYIKMKHKL